MAAQTGGAAGYGAPSTDGQSHYIGEPHGSSRRSLIDDKIAAADYMRYSDGKKEEWLKTTTNHLMSKAYEMKVFLPWAEGFQSHVITGEHLQALAHAGVCSDIDPLKLSQDLWDTSAYACMARRRSLSITSSRAMVLMHGVGSWYRLDHGVRRNCTESIKQ